MKRIVCTFSVVLAVTMMNGCGGKTDTGTSNTTDTAKADATTPAAPSQQLAVKNQDPKSAVTAFLDAMRLGNDKVAEYLLTTKAREETARQNMVVQPPGTPNATYQIGRVEYPKDKPSTAYVECTWTEKYDDGQQDQYEVVWVLHQQKTGWHIAGMATELDDSGSVVFLNFEKPAEMMEKVRQAEQMASQADSSTATSPATAPATAMRPPVANAAVR